MTKKISLFIMLAALSILLSSWGNVGHSMISFRISLSFNEEMSLFNDWVFYMSEHASDADWRKGDDPDEGPKHYIDIDSYSGFIAEGRIPHTLDSCKSEYGSAFVGDNGFLPWATLDTYDSLVKSLERNDISRAKYFAADLGHYVADGHMPMHLTKNYDGQLTGNKGIHSRYEIYMIDRYQDDISYEGIAVEKIENVRDYIFEYIYTNYAYMDSIIIADDYGKEMTGGTSSDLYYAALWERTENLTNKMFKMASHSIAELLYNAWLEAEANKETSTALNKASSRGIFNIEIAPNPVQTQSAISYFIPEGEEVSGSIYDSSGRIKSSSILLPTTPGQQHISIEANMFSKGAYFLVLSNNSEQETQKFLVTH